MMNPEECRGADFVAGGGRGDRTNATSAPGHGAARLWLPPPQLGACVFAGVERNTLGTQLDERERFNYYPATPLALVSWIFEGRLHMVDDPGPGGSAVLGAALPRLVISGPQTQPRASWSPGPVHALSVAFYPEALSRLLETPIQPLVDRIAPLAAVAPASLLALCESLFASAARGDAFDVLTQQLDPLWQGLRSPSAAPYLGDWIRSLAMRAAFSRAGVGVRQLQRRIKGWTGLSQQHLQLFERVERAFVEAARAPAEKPAALADLACGAGFADQSHLGRAVRRVTGLPPAKLLESMRRDEAFWFYRLIQGQLRQR